MGLAGPALSSTQPIPLYIYELNVYINRYNVMHDLKYVYRYIRAFKSLLLLRSTRACRRRRRRHRAFNMYRYMFV